MNLLIKMPLIGPHKLKISRSTSKLQETTHPLNVDGSFWDSGMSASLTGGKSPSSLAFSALDF